MLWIAALILMWLLVSYDSERIALASEKWAAQERAREWETHAARMKRIAEERARWLRGRDALCGSLGGDARHDAA